MVVWRSELLFFGISSLLILLGSVPHTPFPTSNGQFWLYDWTGLTKASYVWAFVDVSSTVALLTTVSFYQRWIPPQEMFIERCIIVRWKWHGFVPKPQRLHCGCLLGLTINATLVCSIPLIVSPRPETLPDTVIKPRVIWTAARTGYKALSCSNLMVFRVSWCVAFSTLKCSPGIVLLPLR
jgi:hypothetical protein